MPWEALQCCCPPMGETGSRAERNQAQASAPFSSPGDKMLLHRVLFDTSDFLTCSAGGPVNNVSHCSSVNSRD